MSGRRALALSATALIGAVLIAGGLAWACTNFIQIDTLSPATASAPGPLAVRGSGAASGAMVELRWNAPNGPVVGHGPAAEDGHFDVQVTVPDVPAGIYVLVASDGRTPIGRAALEIGAAPSGSSDLVMPRDRVAASTSGGTASSHLAVGLLAGVLALTAAGATVMVLRRRGALAHAPADHRSGE